MEKKIGNLFKGDKGIWTVFLFLCLISIVEVFSASSTLTYKTHNYMMPLIYHTAMILVGVGVAIITLNIPCRYFKLLTPLMLVLTYATLLWVLIGGESINGANRVIQLPGFTFQPSEIAKGTMVLTAAQILSAMQREDESGADPTAMKYVLWLVVPATMLIGLENLSTAVLLFSVIFVMMFIARVPLRQMGKLTGVLVLLVAIFLGLVFWMAKLDKEGQELEQAQANGQTEQVVKSSEKKDRSGWEKLTHRFWTWKNRIAGKEDKNVPAEEYKVTDKNFQVTHANFAIASSGIIGKGPGNSVERDYLPQAFSDFIYAIIIEEMGLVGAIAVVFLYVILLFRAARIASRCENNFPAFLVMGLTLLLVFQAVINMCVAVDFGIVTGQPLPLVSKGGTSTIVNCAYIGVILSVSRSAKRKDQSVKTAEV
ncbi:FtsW/RodA/SpoVE family cell cycle protein [Prevotella communis]|jgi:cell division protein FtsW|uniref:Probable peptidoglycan glycosyltransferase FtsW n=1 Tax=Prevotella communis TaxID=2913614 RepID=A0A1H0CZX3_9BACT|nr:FtsW/RodA/SpoVE family cell cycle protein [Prevotella communis]UKK59734.1 FtsW/RodA/SpoVE family cell cycle protein [Prevotella communis]UKK62481.1 FtsW/RodA/SpoVE family cell cycle protein [Prevotella communis]UKK65305.1 FtsW/RodA/SpoVE family cell cycle protein [Prevotella communis]UKK67718.1 FtsW/RodA/SpoVE family cell cycle protein [Prevotella communis]UKK70135.1 FtsW/RodA/SpoVE family cell cycle protein [Prevotella communis]